MSKPSRPVWAEINLDNIRHNIHSIRRQVGTDTDIMAVVKADGYGHGSVSVARAALEAGADRLAVALPEEGMELRAAGIKAPVQVLGEIMGEQARLIAEYDLMATVCRPDTVHNLSQEAISAGGEIDAVIKIDTGMSRIGIRPEDIGDFYHRIQRKSGLNVDSIMTHFATADEADKEFTKEQYERFKRAIENLEQKGLSPGEDFRCQVANSAAVIDMPEYSLDIVRPGIMVYGLHPSPEVDQSFELKPALTLKARIIYLKTVGPGTPISYGRTYVTGEEERIATLPLGYADGYPRLLSNRADVLVKGHRTPIRGRVCMDQIMVDVTGIPGVEIGDEAVLIGGQGDDFIAAGELADLVGTINYEIVSRLGERVPRAYIND